MFRRVLYLKSLLEGSLISVLPRDNGKARLRVAKRRERWVRTTSAHWWSQSTSTFIGFVSFHGYHTDMFSSFSTVMCCTQNKGSRVGANWSLAGFVSLPWAEGSAHVGKSLLPALPYCFDCPAACYLLTNLMTRGSPGKEKAFSWPHLHQASYVHALWCTPWRLSEAASVHLFGQMGCKSSPLLDTHSALQTGCFLFDYCWCKLSATVLGAVKLGSKWQSLWQRTFSPDFFVV